MEDGEKTEGGILLLEENKNPGHFQKEDSNGVKKVEYLESNQRQLEGGVDGRRYRR